MKTEACSARAAHEEPCRSKHKAAWLMPPPKPTTQFHDNAHSNPGPAPRPRPFPRPPAESLPLGLFDKSESAPWPARAAQPEGHDPLVHEKASKTQGKAIKKQSRQKSEVRRWL